MTTTIRFGDHGLRVWNGVAYVDGADVWVTQTVGSYLTLKIKGKLFVKPTKQGALLLARSGDFSLLLHTHDGRGQCLSLGKSHVLIDPPIRFPFLQRIAGLITGVRLDESTAADVDDGGNLSVLHRVDGVEVTTEMALPSSFGCSPAAISLPAAQRREPMDKEPVLLSVVGRDFWGTRPSNATG